MKRKSVDATLQTALEAFRLSKLADGIDPSNYIIEIEGLFKDTKEVLPEVITKENINKIKINLQDSGLSGSSVNHYITTLRVFCYWCMKEGYVEPFKINLIKVQETMPKFFNSDEITKLLVKPSANCTFRESRTYTIICLILATGARSRTVCEMKVEDIDFINKEITYRHLKNKKAATVPLSPVLEKELRYYLTTWPLNDWLFPDNWGGHLTVSALRQGLKAYCKDRGIKPRGAHSLRHAFSREWILNGGGAFQLQHMLTHSSITMTQKYVRIFGNEIQNDVINYAPLDNIKPNKQHITRHSITISNRE